jgi:4-hydroxybenzoate polyprenyltransferase
MEDMNILDRLKKTEESKVAMAIVLSYGLLLATMVLIEYAVAEATIILVALVLFVFFAYQMMKKPKEPRDERSERCSFLATRNGFIVSIIAIGAFMLFARAAALSAHGIVDMLSAIWGAGVVTYILSYLYYQRMM